MPQAAIGPGIGAIGDITGGKKQQNAMNQMGQQGQEAAQAQEQLINQAILPILNTMGQTYQQDFAPLQSGVSGQYGDLLKNLNLAGAYGQNQSYLSQPGSTYMSQLTPQILQALSGLTGQAGGLGQEAGGAYSPLTKPADQAMKLYEQTAKHGLSPQVIGNAENQQQVQNQQAINSIMNQMGPGLANPSGLIQQMQLNDAMSTAQLNSNLAAQNQGLKLQGAQLGTGLGEQLGQNTLQQIAAQSGLLGQQAGFMGQQEQTAGAQDQQTMQMLQSLFQNAMGSAGQMGQYANQGEDMLSQALSGLMGLSQQYGGAAGQDSTNMMNMMSQGGGYGGALTGLGNIFQNNPGLFGGGSSPSGGLNFGGIGTGPTSPMGLLFGGSNSIGAGYNPAWMGTGVGTI